MIPMQMRCEVCDDDVWLSDNRAVISAQIATFTAAHRHDRLQITLHLPWCPESGSEVRAPLVEAAVR